VLLFNCQIQNAADHARDQPFLVRPNDAHGDPTGFRGNHARVRHVAFFIEFDPEKSQAIASPGADRGASGRPIRSTSPARIRRSEPPASNSANLMLDEPPLIVRMRGLAGFKSVDRMVDTCLFAHGFSSRCCNPSARLHLPQAPQALFHPRGAYHQRHVLCVPFLLSSASPRSANFTNTFSEVLLML
jgi:hypothetical protein